MQGPDSLSTHSVYPERALEGSVCAEAQRGRAGIEVEQGLNTVRMREHPRL